MSYSGNFGVQCGGQRDETYRDELISDLAVVREAPSKLADDSLYALLQVQRAEMHTGNIGFRREPLDHGNSEVDTVVLDLLVVVLQ